MKLLCYDKLDDINSLTSAEKRINILPSETKGPEPRQHQRSDTHP